MTPQATAGAPPAVAMRRIDKRFGAVQANRAVDLVARAGTVHAIVGENGAGKSTLMSVLYGLCPADGGSIEVAGRPARIRGPRDAIALGIGMVHQHFMLAERLSALDNVMLGAEPGFLLGPARVRTRGTLQALMERTGLSVDLDAPVEALPVGARQRLEILKALHRGARILILDEPTAVLAPQETAQLFAVLRQLRAQGTTLLLITHKLKEVLALADHVTVMRQGAVVLDGPVAGSSLDGLAEAMVGRRVNIGRDGTAPREPGPVLLRASNLRWTDELGVPRLADVSLALAGGSQLAQARADLIVVNSRLADVAAAIKLAKKGLRIVRENLGWALAYNLAIIPAAALGYLTPALAAVGMAVSSLLVVANALRARQ